METQQFDLEPHEQLDEIDLRTNDDGSVDVKIDRWEKPENDTYVRVYYRRKNVTAVKSALYTFFWIVVIGIIIL